MNRLFGRFDGDDHLERVMLVRRNDLFIRHECGEATIPQIAVWRADSYAREYEQIFGALPDLLQVPRSGGPVTDREAASAWSGLTDAQREDVTRVFVNIGKAIAAYERRIEFGASRFDKYVNAVTTGQSDPNILTDNEIAGLRLFIGRANCTQCHSGPLPTSNEFHNTGVPPRPQLAIDHGRLTGATAVLSDEFNCRSQWSDTRARCSELEFIVTGEHTLDRAHKVPSLRNVAERAPYMDAGQFATLAEVLDHYNRAPAAPTGHSELRRLRLKPVELRQLEAFLRTLSGPVALANLLLPAARNDRDCRSRRSRHRNRRARARHQRSSARPACSRRLGFCRRASSATSSEDFA